MEYLTIEEAAKFHGHLGPFLLLGYMAGTLARETLKPKDEHDLHAEVTLPLKTPYTCVVDGIQCSTRCTLGKLNIKIKPSNKEIITIMIKCKSSGKVLEITVKSLSLIHI